MALLFLNLRIRLLLLLLLLRRCSCCYYWLLLTLHSVLVLNVSPSTSSSALVDILLLECDLTSGSTLHRLGHDGPTIVRQMILIMLQIVHLDLPDVSRGDGLAIFHYSPALSDSESELPLLHILLAGIRHEIGNSQHLCLVEAMA